ncbi:MAG: ATP-binding cassette domain-containing protein [Desulfovibrio sp.]|nr:ATP-binding cassette domain-containing protein [Desulfovibrio sp.]
MDAVFSIRNLGKSRPGGFCLHLEALDIARGSLIAFAGPSGCGKSTALDILACALRPEPYPEAEVPGLFLFSPTPGHTTDVLAAWRRGGIDALAALRLRHMGYVLQTGGLLPFLTAQENILLHCEALGMGMSGQERALELAEQLGISHLLKQYPDSLSVGERQRVAIARALAHGPQVVLADEPTAALDPWHAANVLHLFSQIARHMGLTIVMVSHAPELAQSAGFSLVHFTVSAEGEMIRSRTRHLPEA